MKQDRVKATFEITDLSKGLSMSDVQRATFRLFTTPVKIPSDRPVEMTLEEFILGERKGEN